MLGESNGEEVNGIVIVEFEKFAVVFSICDVQLFNHKANDNGGPGSRDLFLGFEGYQVSAGVHRRSGEMATL